MKPEQKYFLTILFTVGVCAVTALAIHTNFPDSWPTIIYWSVIALITVLLFVAASWRLIKRNHLLNLKPIAPEYSLNEIKFYEVGVLLDGHLSKEDALAISTYYYLNQHKQPELHGKLYKWLNRAAIMRLYNELYARYRSNEDNKAQKLLSEISVPVYKGLIDRGYFIYNPRRVKTFASGIFGVLLLIVYVIASAVGFSYDVSLGLPSTAATPVADLMLMLTFALLTPIYAWILVFAEYFHENLARIMAERRKILGYKMFLQRVEWHTVERDEQKFKRYMPYFFKFDLKQEKMDDMIKHVLAN